ncbi:MAG TPA: tannase/feruloyl esterase family alpha/beta hydrolase [Gammaproteobacteria bacterium]|nr:tannase/feruloyl esterase family alpha/beta hydrolase [Gammaproteobacteria bacterium]
MPTMSKSRLAATVVAGALAATFACTFAEAQPFADASASRSSYATADLEPSGACDGLASFKTEGLVRLSATAVAAEGAAPAHCRVSGVLDPAIAFEVNLPSRWNGRLYMIGNGGLAGEAPDDPGRAAQRASALANGFAMVSTNTGHYAREEPQGTFVLSNPQKAIDYAYRAVHLTAVTAKDVAKEYYSKPVERAYWNSCSNGGRQGLIEAQRYPEDFDGIIANAPWVDQTGFTVGAVWNQRAVTEQPISAGKIALVAKSVMAKCDAVDGLADGLIDDPRQCPFHPARDVPSCPAGEDSDSCLTPAEAGTFAKIYGGPVSGGKPFFPGYMVGSEALVPGPNGTKQSGWTNLIVPGRPDAKPADFGLGEAILRYLVFVPPQPDYDFRKFDFDRDVGLLTLWGSVANAKNPDLSKFRARGGKLIMTYGWADSILQPMMGVHYYERAVEANGPETRDFFRLFMVPGMAHCAGGVGPDQVDSVTAMIDWVEKGTAPDSLVARKIVDGQVTRSRPLCPYPQVARYKGEGSIDEAANFACRAP